MPQFSGSSMRNHCCLDGAVRMRAASCTDDISGVWSIATDRKRCRWSAVQERAPEDAYLGDLGPILRGTVGDIIKVTFLNKIDRALSIHPHGVFYTKANEGALYNDGTSGAL